MPVLGVPNLFTYKEFQLNAKEFLFESGVMMGEDVINTCERLNRLKFNKLDESKITEVRQRTLGTKTMPHTIRTKDDKNRTIPVLKMPRRSTIKAFLLRRKLLTKKVNIRGLKHLVTTVNRFKSDLWQISSLTMPSVTNALKPLSISS